MTAKKTAVQKELDVLKRLRIIRDDQYEDVEKLMRYFCIKEDVRETIRTCIDRSYFDLIGQFEDEDTVSK